MTNVRTQQRRSARGLQRQDTLEDDEVGLLMDMITKNVAAELIKASQQAHSEYDEPSESTTSTLPTDLNINTVAEFLRTTMDVTKGLTKEDGLLGPVEDEEVDDDDDDVDVWDPDFWCADLVDQPQALESSSDPKKTISISDFLNCHSPRSPLPLNIRQDDVSSLSGISDIFTEFTNQDVSYHESALPVIKEDEVEKGKPRGVRFDKVVIREYTIELGDNPACTSGPSLTIGWEYFQHSPIRLDDFESVRIRRSCKKQLILSRAKREKILKRSGYPDSAIAEAIRRTNKARSERKQTTNSLGNYKLGSAIMVAAKKVKKLVFLSKAA